MRKGQAAFEFLSTYGWAVFAALAIIAALTTFGFTNLKTQIPSSCYLGTDFICDGAVADTSGQVLIEFSPVFKLHIDTMICEYPNNVPSVKQEYNGITVFPNKKYIIGCEDSSLNLPENKDKMGVKIIYHLNETGALPRVADGEIVADISKTPLNMSLLNISKS